MLLVKTRLGLSQIHGIGLFAEEFIKEGTPIWVFHEGFDLKIDPSALKGLPPVARQQIKHYGYVNMKSGKIILCADDARFFNHAVQATALDIESDDEEGVTVAARDIEIGEEICSDYLRYDADARRKLCLDATPE